MSATVLSKIKEVKKYKDRKWLFTYWLLEFENQPWARVLDSRDWEILLASRTWEEFLKALDKVEAKYTKAWKFLNCPATTEEWLKLIDWRTVDGKYWQIVNEEVDYSECHHGLKHRRVQQGVKA